jgi:hypothetical protein
MRRRGVHDILEAVAANRAAEIDTDRGLKARLAALTT